MSLKGTGSRSSTYNYPPYYAKAQDRLSWLLTPRVSITNSFPHFPLDLPVLKGRCWGPSSSEGPQKT
jgi:hypothetical protein